MAAARALLARAHGRPAVGRAAVLALVAVSAIGCGSQHRVDGKAIYVRDCAGCHTLTGHEHGASGGDLLIATRHLDARTVASFARVMPVYPRLDARAADAVARYIESSRR